MRHLIRLINFLELVQQCDKSFRTRISCKKIDSKSLEVATDEYNSAAVICIKTLTFWRTIEIPLFYKKLRFLCKSQRQNCIRLWLQLFYEFDHNALILSPCIIEKKYFSIFATFMFYSKALLSSFKNKSGWFSQ